MGLDEWLAQVRQCEPLAENDLRQLCEMVRAQSRVHRLLQSNARFPDRATSPHSQCFFKLDETMSEPCSIGYLTFSRHLSSSMA